MYIPPTIGCNLSCLYFNKVKEIDVLQAISNLKSNLTMEPDLVPSMLIKDNAVVFTPVLTHIFNIILVTCKFSNLCIY